jgi:hypothetical protein
VPVNYSNGALVNISIASPNIAYYVNTINFIDQAMMVSSSYNNFSGSLSDHKILMFMTSLFIRAAVDNISFPVAIDFNINAQIINSSSYLINASLGRNSYVDKLHFSMIIFN